MVIELPPGALMWTVNDLHQRWVLDMGLPGPDRGQGGKHLILPLGYDGDVPEGYPAATPTTHRVIVLLRALQPHGNLHAGIELMRTAKVYPLHRAGDWETSWVGLSHDSITPRTRSRPICATGKTRTS